MVKIETLIREGKVNKIKETELDRYINFFTESYKDNLSHSESTKKNYPRWSIISGYYAMHDISKLLIAKLYMLKIEKEVHATTIKVLRELVMDKQIIELMEKAHDEFSSLASELSDAKKERVKVQYYTGTEFMKEKYKEKATEFYDNIVVKFMGKIKELLEK